MTETPTYSIRYLDGELKIMAIKLVRELTGLGLAEAKSAVEGRQIVMRGLERAAAEAIAARFADEARAQVDLLEEAEFLYAFDPRHPERGGQELLRLRWWGTELSWERGRIGEWQRERSESFASVEARDRAIARQREQWLAADLELTEREVVLVDRVSARDRQLEQQIREGDADAVSVYADWLQRQGDPRGLIMALALTREGDPSRRDELERALGEALLEHRTHLFGGIDDPAQYVELEWWAGMIVGISLVRESGKKQWPHGDRDLLENLLALPICACLRTLRTNSWVLRDPEFWTMVYALDPARLAGLRQMECTTLYLFNAGGVEWSRFPGLERLDLVTNREIELELPRLHTLIVRPWFLEMLVTTLRECKLPELRRLTIVLDHVRFDNEATVAQMRAMLVELFALPVVTSLDSLRLEWEGGWDLEERPVPRWVAEALISASGLRGLAEIDLGGVMFDAAGQELLRAAKEHMPNLLIG